MNNEMFKSAILGFVGLVMCAIGLTLFPNTVLLGADQIRTATNATKYAGLTQVNGVLPLVVLCLWFFIGAISLFFGAKGIYESHQA